MSKKEALMFFVSLFGVWVLVTPAVELIFDDDPAGYIAGLVAVPNLVGALVGSAVAACVMYGMKNKSPPAN